MSSSRRSTVPKRSTAKKSHNYNIAVVIKLTELESHSVGTCHVKRVVTSSDPAAEAKHMRYFTVNPVWLKILERDEHILSYAETNPDVGTEMTYRYLGLPFHGIPPTALEEIRFTCIKSGVTFEHALKISPGSRLLQFTTTFAEKVAGGDADLLMTEAKRFVIMAVEAGIRANTASMRMNVAKPLATLNRLLRGTRSATVFTLPNVNERIRSFLPGTRRRANRNIMRRDPDLAALKSEYLAQVDHVMRSLRHRLDTTAPSVIKATSHHAFTFFVFGV